MMQETNQESGQKWPKDESIVPTKESPSGGKNFNTSEKAKQYASEGVQPFIELFGKYRGDLEPFIDSIKRALRAGVNELRQGDNSSKQDVMVARKLEDASSWIGSMEPKLKNKSGHEVYETIESECRKHPGMSFGLSYVIGLVTGRLLRHLDKPSKSIQRFKFSQ